MARFLKIFFIEAKLLSYQLGSVPDPGAYSVRPELQAQVFGHALAIQSEVLGQVLKNLLHGSKTPFGSIEAQARPRGIYSALWDYRPRFSVACWPYRAKCSARFLKIFFMETKLLSVQLRPKARPRGILW